MAVGSYSFAFFIRAEESINAFFAGTFHPAVVRPYRRGNIYIPSFQARVQAQQTHLTRPVKSDSREVFLHFPPLATSVVASGTLALRVSVFFVHWLDWTDENEDEKLQK